jgi:hypothetical protein
MHTLASIMNTSASENWLIAIVSVVVVALLITVVVVASLRPHRRPSATGRRFRVQGGMHTGGGGRSVAPRRDEPVTMNDEELSPQDAVSRKADVSTRRGTDSPMDL